MGGAGRVPQPLPRDGITAVVPVFNSESSLKELVERLEPVLVACAPAHEIVLVDDGSSDGSWRAVRTLAQSNPAVRPIRLARNYGQHSALLVGVRAARYSTIVTLDDDLQDLPEDIPLLTAALTEGVDVVYGMGRYETRNLWRALATRITKRALRRLVRRRPFDDFSGFRAFRTQLREAFATHEGPFVVLDVLLTWGTESFDSVAVTRGRRREGRSTYRLTDLGRHSFNMVVGFNARPLQFFIFIGAGLVSVGSVVLSYTLIHHAFLGGPILGAAFLASAIAMSAGVQLVGIGILGEYAVRILSRLSGTPAYVIAEEPNAVEDCHHDGGAS